MFVSNVSDSLVIILLEVTPSSLHSTTFYCSAYKLGFVPSTVSAVLQSNIRSSSILAPLSNRVKVTLSGLDPLARYTSYCYAVNAVGQVAYNLSTIKRSRLDFNTSCCKIITFTNVPTSVFVDLAYYEGQWPSTFLFSFSLSSIPHKDITITPIITALNSPAKMVSLQAVPPEFVFSSTSNNLVGSFYLNGTVAVDTSIAISLQFAGPSKFEFSNTTTASTLVLMSKRPVPPPVLSKSTLSDLGNSIYIIFSGPTNKAENTKSVWPCSELFNFTGSKFSSCSWLNSSTVVGNLPLKYSGLPIVNVGDSVIVYGDLVKAACSAKCGGYLPMKSMEVVLQRPVNPISPTVVLKVPSQVSNCSYLTIDATQSYGDGNRLWTDVTWSVTSNGGDSAAQTLQLYLSKFGAQNISTKISVPPSLLRLSKYTISLSLVNIFGLESAATSFITVSQRNDIPSVSIAGASSAVIYPSTALKLFSTVYKSPCSASSTLTYNWAIFENGKRTNISTTDRDPTVFSLRPYILSPNNLYIVILNVSASGSTAPSSASIPVTVLSGPVTANVVGGYNRQFYISSSSSSNTTLDASISTDGNLNPPYHLKFSWSCTVSSFLNFGTDCSNILSDRNLSTIALLHSTMSEGRVYSVRVVVKTADGRSDSKTVVIQPTGKVVPELQIASNISRFNPGAQFNISSSIKYSKGPVQAIWTASISGNSVSFSSLTSQSVKFNFTQASSSVQFPIVIAGGNFIPGSLVSFRISAYAGGSFSFSEITLQANLLPTGGSLTVAPTSGFRLETFFSILSNNWVVDSQNLPLYYSFFYAMSSASPLLFVSRKSTANSVSTQLPSGLISYDNKLFLSVFVYDYYDNLASVNSSVEVKENPTVQFNASKIWGQQFAAFRASKDTGALVSSINAVSSTLNIVNCSQATARKCASLNRTACNDVPNTCSSCLPGYRGTHVRFKLFIHYSLIVPFFLGIVGASNIACQYTNKTKILKSGGSQCSSNSECLYGNCTTAGVCSEPLKQCPSQCSGRGKCTYFDVSGNVLSTGCKISETSCSAVCNCNSNYGGVDCSLTSEALKEKSKLRGDMCNAISNIADVSTPSAQLLDTMVSSLMSAYDPNEVLEDAKRSCTAVLSLCTQLTEQGYLLGASTSTIGILSQTLSRFFVSRNTTASVSGRRLLQSNSSEGVDESVSKFTKGVLNTLVEGQSFRVVSDNLQISFHKDAVRDIKYMQLQPGQTTAQSEYGVVPPTLSFGNLAAARALDVGGGYCSMAITQYGSNPYPNSQQAITSIFRLSYDTLNPTNSPEKPFYYITLQFNRKQNLPDFNSITSTATNHTFPECNTYDSLNATYRNCTHCQISWYTKFNVTYKCSSILPDQHNSNRRLSASLASTATSEYTAILQTAVKQVSKVLSLNPATIDTKKSMVALVIVGSLAWLIIIVALFLARWDHYDHHRAIYIKNKLEKDNKVIDLQDSYNIEEEEEEEKSSEKHPTFMRRSQNMLKGLKKRLQKKTKVIQPFKFDRKGGIVSRSDEGDIAGYIGDVIDEELLKKDKPFLISFLKVLWKDHEYLNVFSERSLAVSRVSRWMMLCCRLMITLFVDTIFFNIYYADDGSCSMLTTPDNCLASINTATEAPFCEWTSDSTVLHGGFCTMADPPNTVLYSIIVAMVCITVSFPVVLLFDVLFFSVAVYRPDISKLGFIHPELWLGRSSNIKVNQKNIMVLYDQSENTATTIQPSEVNKISDYSYMDKVTPVEEADLFIDKVEHALKAMLKAGFFLFNSAHLNDSDRATLGAIIKYAGINPDGSLRRLPVRQLLYYGTAKKRLEAKIRRTRLQQRVIRDVLESKGELEVKNKDKALIQYFVKEQFNSFKQYVLRFHYGLLCNDATTPLVHPVPWLISWAIIVLSLIFFLYWILAWSVSGGGNAVISSWAWNFTIIVVQDLTLVNVLRLLTIHVIAMLSIRPQLKYIHQVLTNVAIGLTQNAAIFTATNEFSAFQHLSPACRAARMKVSENLFSAQILRRIRDVDVKTCRTNNDLGLAILVLILLSLPLLLSLTSEVAGESVFSTFVGILCDSFILLNQFLLSISVFVLLAPYVVFLGLYFTRFWWARSVLNKVNKFLSEVYYRRNRYSQWRQSLRNRRHMGLFSTVRILMSYLKRTFLRVYHFLLKLLTVRKRTFVTRDEHALMWKNMNSAITVQSNGGGLTLLFVLGSQDLNPSRRSKPLSNCNETRSSYTTTVLNTHMFTSGTTTAASGAGGAPSRGVLKAARGGGQEELSIYTPSSQQGSHRRDILEYYSSLFSLPQLTTRFTHYHSADAEGQRDVDYVIDLRKERPLLDDRVREQSKKFRTKKRDNSAESEHDNIDNNCSVFIEGGSRSTDTIDADNETYEDLSSSKRVDISNSLSYEESPGAWPIVEDTGYDIYNYPKSNKKILSFEESPLQFDDKPHVNEDDELLEKARLDYPSYDDSNLLFSERNHSGRSRFSLMNYIIDMRKSKSLLDDSTRERSKQFRSSSSVQKLSSAVSLLPPPPPLSLSSSSSPSSILRGNRALEKEIPPPSKRG